MKLTVELSRTQWRLADISPAILARNYKGMPTFLGGIGGVMEILVYDEQNKSIRKDIVNTIVTDGSSPKHNPRVIEMAEGGWRNTAHTIRNMGG